VVSAGANLAAGGDAPDQSGSFSEPDGHTWTVPFSASAVQVARAAVTHVLRQARITGQVIEDARVVVSELLGNALRHARPLPDGTLRVILELDPTSIRICVVDGGSATLPTLQHPPPMSVGGRGLSIVRTLTQNWGVQESRSGNTVFGVLNLS
jgi:anti-sigma regulatory factor (Ser/Thr protein kinase)